MASQCKWYHACPIKRFYEQGWIARHWVDFYCQANWKKCKRFELEESSTGHPDYMLPDGSLNSRLKK